MKNIFRIIQLVIVIIVMSTVTYAWFAMQKRANPIDASSGNVQFSYRIEANKTYNDEAYSISNLTFFDINNTNEINYFKGMACEISLTIYNTGDIDCDFEVSQIIDEMIDKNTMPYAFCIFSNNKIDSVAGSTSIADLILEKNVASGSIAKKNGSTISSVTVYAYLIGVQPNVNSNNDFLDDKYTLSIKMSVTQKIK